MIPSNLSERSSAPCLAAHDAVDSLALHCRGLAVMAARLHELIDEASQAYALAGVPSAAAIRTFGRALLGVRGAATPRITLTPSGGIWAEWCDQAARSVALVILQDGSARVGAVLQVQECAGRPLHVDVEGDVEAVVERLRTDRDLCWVVGGAAAGRPP